jgi:hypothetical protein
VLKTVNKTRQTLKDKEQQDCKAAENRHGETTTGKMEAKERLDSCPSRGQTDVSVIHESKSASGLGSGSQLPDLPAWLTKCKKE